MKIGSWILLCGFVFALPAYAQIDMQEPSSVLVKDAFARISPTGSGAAYMVFENTTQTPVALVSASSDIAQKTEIHTIEKDENGIKRMFEIPSLSIPAGSETFLKPGGYHIMLMGIDKTLSLTDHVSLRLEFDNGLEKQVNVPIEDIGKRPGTHHTGHNHTEHD